MTLSNIGARLTAPLSVVFILALISLPIVGLISGAVNPTENPFHPHSANLRHVLTQAGVWVLLFNTFSIAITTSIFALLIGSWFAWIEQRGLYWGRKTFSLFSLLPLAVPSYLLAGTLRETFGKHFTGFIPTVIVLTLITVPYVQLIVSATLARLSRHEEEAARTLGQTPWQVFYSIVLPQLRPGLAFAWLLIQLYVISDFGAIAILDYPALTWRLYQAVSLQQLDYAIILGAFLLLLTLPVLVIRRWIQSRIQQNLTSGNPQPPQPHKLSLSTKIISYLLHAFVIGLGFLLPIIALMKWVIQGISQHRIFAPLWEPIYHTTVIALTGTFFILLVAFVPAWISARKHSQLHWRLRWITEQSIYFINALPGILVAFGLLLAALSFSRMITEGGYYYGWLLKSGLLLLLGYTLRFLPNAHANLKTAILLLRPHLWDNARLLGSTRWRWFWHIAIPALKPGLSAAFILVLLSIIKELPITLLLGNAMGLHTLSFRIFDRYQEAFLHDAGLAGLVILSLSVSCVLLTRSWRRYA
jgi:iron(III) transport system permease protein